MSKNPNRDYKKEAKYHAKPEQVKRRMDRNNARAAAMRAGKVKKGDGKEVHHVGAQRTGRLDNNKVAVVSAKENRSIQPKRKTLLTSGGNTLVTK